jgi:lipoprotein
MKTLFSVLMVMAMMVFIAGCGSSEEKGVFVQEEGSTKITYEVYHKKDAVTKVKMITESDAKELGDISDEELKKFLDEAVESFKKEMEGVDGIEITGDVKEGKATMEITADVEKVKKSSPDKAKELLTDEADISSYEAVKASLEKIGFKESK